MRRRLNFTQRIRIAQSDITIRLNLENGPPLSFVAERSLASYDLRTRCVCVPRSLSRKLAHAI